MDITSQQEGKRRVDDAINDNLIIFPTQLSSIQEDIPESMAFIELQKRSIFHYEAIMKATEVGCYCCLARFRLRDFRYMDLTWTDDGETLLCPYCEVDAVIYGEDALMCLREIKDIAFKVPLKGEQTVLTSYRGSDQNMKMVILTYSGDQLVRIKTSY